METCCQKYHMFFPYYGKRLKQLSCRHITNIRQIQDSTARVHDCSLMKNKYEKFPAPHKQLLNFQLSQPRYFSSETSCKFNELISPSNKERTQKNLHLTKPVRQYPLKKDFRKAAILIPMCMIDGDLSLLLTLRSIHLKNHRREVSFPGGMMEESDADITVTALRETNEEIGLDPKLIDVWGIMQPITNKNASKLVTPVIGFCRDIDMDAFCINPNEVENVFSVTIKGLCDARYQRTTQMRSGTGYTLPVYLNGSHRIWGLTAAVIHQFLSILAPDLYRFRIRHQRSLYKLKTT
ncbi:nucleoside diphosphate-linked moiety X motif 8-like [Argonauta hians]